MKNILVADDEKEIVELIELFLSKENVNVCKAYDGKQALEYMERATISLAVIDIMMPELNGFEVIKQIRQRYHIPLILLSARMNFADKVLGLEIGADDYITKPFNPLELVARIRAHLRRFYSYCGETEKGNTQTIKVGNLVLDLDCCTLYKDTQAINLTTTEYKIVEYLMSQIGRVFTKQQIFEHIWKEYYYEDENAIRVHISNLRDKIEDDSKQPKYLKTVRGLGYKISELE